ncbi:MAG: S-adenosylmethionine:tRNA ribosyltransferase-isomerase [Bacteroidales bacterium]|nr:S-adenosylmethionine:tRNA ribosyltransferase-isomerase [Bacteroidales bacterium]
MNFNELQIKDYNYELPENRIAKYPLPERDSSKLLVYEKGKISNSSFSKLTNLFSSNELFVFNNTKVIQARLNFKKITGANIEIFCLEPVEPTDYNLMFQSVKSCKWKCIVGNLKKWKTGNLNLNVKLDNSETVVKAKKEESFFDSHIIEFSWDNPGISFGNILEQTGQTPIPPYLKRKSEEDDKKRYQTVYSKHKGSVAAPTAGLHFTENVLKSLSKKGIDTGFITLHVGAGTFKPVKSDFVSEHEMHTEHFSVTKDLIEKLILKAGKITAVGTTTVRTLESLYYLGLRLEQNPDLSNFHIKQWEVYDMKQSISSERALKNILTYMLKKGISKIDASTQIIIVPGFKFRLTDKLITNFHQPKSTLLLLIAAFIGKDWKKVYDFALNNNFRFLSYGDSSVLIK